MSRVTKCRILVSKKSDIVWEGAGEVRFFGIMTVFYWHKEGKISLSTTGRCIVDVSL